MNIQLKVLWVCLITQGKHFVFGQFGDYLSQLEYLMMDVGSFEGIRGSNKVPLLCNLKLLTLSCLNASRGPFGMLRCYHLVASFAKGITILASAQLTFFTIFYRKSRIEKNSYISAQISPLVSGFSGNKLSMDFVMSIFDFVIELEKIEITSVYLVDVANSLVKRTKG
ncbi:hypothetical protein J1N35_034853 [Gossypium stocksii]|uniref:Uncharacterized protein n=1 Tax=Gossypium stocksii TaxID=47602 RepID=A0A9D3USW7_9ROSI|nr:hypothetical protein J1N35_034853 [Gossypium stocksii]